VKHFKMHAVEALLVLMVACQTRHTAAAFDYDGALGVAVVKQDRACLDIRNAALAAGQKIRIITTSPQTIVEAEITGKAEQACTTADQNKPGLYHYAFKAVQGSLQKAVPAFALTKFNGTLTVRDGGVLGDLDGDGRLESFRSCTSSEGVHLTVWTGKPLEGRRKWHYYYYLGYDVEPNCAESDTRPDMP
jgi:hypothetical protein